MKKRSHAYDGANIEWVQRSVRSPRATFGNVRYRPGGYCGPRVQRDYQLVVLLSGSCVATVDEREKALSVGDVYLFKPGRREVFTFSPVMQSHHLWCSVSPESLPAAVRRRINAAVEEAHAPSECFKRLVSAAFLLRTEQSASAQQVVDALALALFCEFLDMVEHATASLRQDLCVERAVRYMEDHFGEGDCLTGAQRAAGCSANALIYKFARAVGTTPARYLWRVRAEKGLGLLVDTGLSVGEIAEQCGFRNPFHFSRRVRQLQGKPPREIRRQAWDDDAHEAYGKGRPRVAKEKPSCRPACFPATLTHG